MQRGRILLLSILIPSGLAWFVNAQPTQNPTPPATPAASAVSLNGHHFTLPPGFEIELVAGPPLVNRPITADFDEQGRLYVAESSGSNEPVAQQLEKKPHRIVRLEDTDGDGDFDKSTVFADKMMFPEGTMWYDGSLYVAAPPSIWKLTDTDGDGVADRREEWFKGKTLTGCANDLHGPYLGPDGWIYWCKGAFAQQTYERPGKKPFVTRASHIFRARPDGSGIEQVMTGGMDNPVDTVFMPNGDRIFTTTFFQHPGGGQRDGLIHAIYGGVYGKDHDPIYEHVWTGPTLMPVLTHMGPAAPCGLHRFESDAWGKEYRDNLFACQFNLRKVSRHVLTPDGSTYQSADSDFVVSDSLDFHPTDVLEDADGTLIVVDTGGWYKLCCPTSQLVKPDVLGGIYRVTKKGQKKSGNLRDVRWDGGDFVALIQLLDDPRPAVRKRAIAELVRGGERAVEALTQTPKSGHSVRTVRNRVWAATLLPQPEAREFVRETRCPANSVKQAVLYSVALHRDAAALPIVLQMMRHEPSPIILRLAAEALGRIGDPSAVPTLFELLREKVDRGLEHAVIYALIEIGKPEPLAERLSDSVPAVRRAAMIALDQMGSDRLKRDIVLAELNSPDAAMKEAAWWIVGRHTEWGEALAGFFRDQLANESVKPDDLARQLARLGRSEAIQKFLAERVSDHARSPAGARVALKAMASSGLRQTPDSWIAAVAKALASADADMLREAMTTLRQLPSVKRPPVTELRAVARGEKWPPDIRFAAMTALPPGPLDGETFSSLMKHVGPEHPANVRSSAAEVLSKSSLNGEQLVALAKSLPTVGPMDIDRLVEPFARSTDESVGLALIASLKESSARSALRVETLKPRLTKYNAKVQQQAETLYALLNAELAQQREKLESVLAGLKQGDVRRGQAVFNSSKAVCISCHAIGYVGGKVGPDLTHIGKIRTERDLLEAVLYPSASFVRSYEPVQVVTKNGKVLNGVLRKDAPDEVVLALNATEEVRVARDDIDELEPGKVSIMPTGLDQQLTPQELADLVAFLKACQ